MHVHTPDLGSFPVLNGDHAHASQPLHCFADYWATHTKGFHQLAFRRHLIAGLQVFLLDESDQLLKDDVRKLLALNSAFLDL
ncbi:hypothetical protein D3C81_1927690 [compost metagenome]